MKQHPFMAAWLFAAALAGCSVSDDGADSGAGADALGAVDASLGALDDTSRDTRRAWVSLIDHSLWTDQLTAADPFTDGPASGQCAPGSWKLEDGVVELDMSACDVIALQQPAQVAVAAGTSLHVVAWHLTLRSPTEPDEAHFAIAAGDVTLWEARIPIPAAAGIFDVELTAPAAVPAGTPITLHLHNHGSNTYKLLELEALTDP